MDKSYFPCYFKLRSPLSVTRMMPFSSTAQPCCESTKLTSFKLPTLTPPCFKASWLLNGFNQVCGFNQSLSNPLPLTKYSLVCIKLQPNTARNKNKAIKIFRGERGAGDIRILDLTMIVMGYFITGTAIDRSYQPGKSVKHSK